MKVPPIGLLLCSFIGCHVDGYYVAPDSRPSDADDANTGADAILTTYGGSNDERTVGVHHTSDGLVFTGTLASDATLGTFQLDYGGGSDFVIAKLDASGTPVWVHVQNDVDHEEIAGSAIDSTGNVIVTGRFAGAVSFGGAMLSATAPGYDMFLAKYSGADGSHLWSLRYGTDSAERPSALAVDSAGDVYVVGSFTGTTNLGGANMSSDGLTDAFVAKYRGTDGAFIWGTRFGGTDQDAADNVAVNGAKVAVGGRFRGTINIGGTVLSSQGFEDIVLAGFDSASGTPVWSARYGGQPNNDSSAGLVTDGNNLYMTGAFIGSAQFGGPLHVAKGSADVYVAKYDLATGAYIWSRTFGDNSVESGARLLLAGPNLIITGKFNSLINFGGGNLYSAGADDVFVATLSQSEGRYVDGWRLGGTQSEEGTALALTPAGDIVLGGKFQGVTYFGTVQRTSMGGADAFIFKP